MEKQPGPLPAEKQIEQCTIENRRLIVFICYSFRMPIEGHIFEREHKEIL